MTPFYINDIFLPLLQDESRYLVLYGGAGSGKSNFAAQKCILRAASEAGHRIVYVRKVARTLRNSSFLLMKDIIKDYNIPCQIKESTMDIVFNGSEIISAGLDDVDKLKSLSQPTSIWVEEATEISQKDLTQLNIRLRGEIDTYFQTILTFNPINRGHWLYQHFFVNPPPGTKVLKSTYLDNHYIDPDYRIQMDAMKAIDEDYYNVYALGEWGMPAKGLIYTYKLIESFPDVDYIYGLDFGFNVPTALLKVGVKENDVFVEELIYQEGLTNGDLIQMLPEHVPNKHTEIYADAAEPQRIAEIHRKGFNIKPADKSVTDGIDTVRRFNIHVVRNSQSVINEIDAYKYKEDKNGMSLEEPVKLNDHAMDAMRYAIHTHYGKLKKRIHGFVSR